MPWVWTSSPTAKANTNRYRSHVSPSIAWPRKATSNRSPAVRSKSGVWEILALYTCLCVDRTPMIGMLMERFTSLSSTSFSAAVCPPRLSDFPETRLLLGLGHGERRADLYSCYCTCVFRLPGARRSHCRLGKTTQNAQGPNRQTWRARRAECFQLLDSAVHQSARRSQAMPQTTHRPQARRTTRTSWPLTQTPAARTRAIHHSLCADYLRYLPGAAARTSRSQ